MEGHCTSGGVTGAPDADLEAAYQSAVYEVELPGGSAVLRIGDTLDGAPGPFAIVTAWNPGRERLSRAANERRNEELRAEIDRRGLRWCAAEGRSLDGSHREPSFAVFVPSPGEAVDLARAFGQAAIAWYDGAELHLVWC